MKLTKFYLTAIVILFCVAFANAQDDNTKPRFVIEPYFGYITGDYENRVFSARAETINAPLSFGNRLELKLTKNFSFGLDVNYANVKIGWDYIYATDGVGGVQVIYGKKKSVQKLRVMANVKLYFAQTETIQAYAVWGFGSRFVKQTDLVTNLPIYENRSLLTFRTGVGFKYYLTKNLGIMSEIGLGGGSLFQFGLSVRF